MPSLTGRHELGPQSGTLSVHTGKTGAASIAGHNLVIEVTSWDATLEIGDALEHVRIELTADGGSLRVRASSGGAQALGDDDMAGIQQTIDDEILKGQPIEFRSHEVEVTEGGAHMSVEGELELLGNRHPISFELSLDDGGRLTGTATLKQTDWGMKPYSTLFGTLKVADAVKVTIEANVFGD